MNAREEIITLLRGQVACPLLSCLGEAGWLDRMQQGAFSPDAFSSNVDSSTLDAILHYLVALGLLEWDKAGEQFEATPLGRKVFKRYGAFCLLNSYEDYFRNFRTLLFPDNSPRPTVNRLRNVIGSGQLHAHKFFPAALSLVAGSKFSAIADIGCGDGQFLEIALGEHLAPQAVAVDLSVVATETTTRRLCQLFPTATITSIVTDGINVSVWSKKLPAEEKTLISLWFVAHEFSQGRLETVTAFFQHLQRQCPRAEVLLGEIVSVPDTALSANRSESIMPEFLLFHALSGQNVLSWDDWLKVRDTIPYTVKGERHFDVVSGTDGQSVPSSFLWHLVPQ